MKKFSILIAGLVMASLAGCSSGESDQKAERLDKPYADKIKAVEQKQLQQADDQLKAIDEQTSGKPKDDEDGG